MNTTRIYFKPGNIGLAMDPVMLVTPVECLGNLDYPGYNVYYSGNRRDYTYLKVGTWVSRPAPQDVSVDIPQASDAVRMDFHDAPAK